MASGALSFRRAVLLAAGCNLAGVAATSLYMPAVAQTVCEAADFGGDPATACTALCAALLAVVLWATLAWRFGIPTSESHALLSGLAGAALSLPGGWNNLRPAAWGKVGLGLLLSVLLGFLLGRWAGGLLHRLPSLPAGAAPSRQRARRPWPFSTGPRTGRNSWGSFLLGGRPLSGTVDLGHPLGPPCG